MVKPTPPRKVLRTLLLWWNHCDLKQSVPKETADSQADLTYGPTHSAIYSISFPPQEDAPHHSSMQILTEPKKK
eukprot:6474148-Amphidinium_carterae.1